MFGNAVYSVKFDERDWAEPYGHRYTFFLQDAVEEVPEYVVYWDNFVTCVVGLSLSSSPRPRFLPLRAPPLSLSPSLSLSLSLPSCSAHTPSNLPR